MAGFLGLAARAGLLDSSLARRGHERSRKHLGQLEDQPKEQCGGCFHVHCARMIVQTAAYSKHFLTITLDEGDQAAGKGGLYGLSGPVEESRTEVLCLIGPIGRILPHSSHQKSTIISHQPSGARQTAEGSP